MITAAAAVCAGLGIGSGVAAAANNTPIILTGWNQDLVAENTNGLTSTTSPFDVSNNYIFYENGVIAGGAGLPVIGSFVSATNSSTTFQYQPYTANNALFFNDQSTVNGATINTTGTLTLAATSAYTSLAFLGAAANGAATLSYTLNFSNGTTQPETMTLNDWFNNTPYAITSLGREQRVNPLAGGDNTSSTSGNPRMYEVDLTLPSNEQLLGLSSISFTQTSGNSAAIFAVSGAVNSSIVYFSGTANGSTNGSFDTSTTNFLTGDGTGSALAFANSDAVIFDDTAATGTISVTSGGVSPGSLTFNNNSRAYTFSNGAVNVSGGATFNGSASVSFNDAVTLIAGASINSGTVVIGPTGSLNTSSASVASGATLTFLSGATQSGTFALTGGGTVNVNGTALTAGGATNFTGSFGGANGSLNLAGGSVTVNSASAIAPLTKGITVGTAGTASLLLNDNSGAAGAGITLTLGSSGTLGTPSGSGGATYAGPIVLAATVAAPATIQTDGGLLTLPGNITGVGSLSLAGSNGGSFALGGTNTYAGNTLIAGDPALFAPDTVTVTLNSDGGFSPNGGLVISTANKGYLNVDLNGHNPTVQFLSGTSNNNYQIINTGQSTSTLTITNVNNGTGAATFSTAITGNVALLKAGTTGNQTLNGNNSYSGGTTVTGGTLTVGASSALGYGPVTLAGGTLAFSQASLSSFTTQGGNFTPTYSGGTLMITNGGGNENTSAFLSSPVKITSSTNLTVSYTYTANDPANPKGYIADGAAFVIQNDPRGPTAVGGGGGSIGYAGNGAITNSLAVGYELYGYDFGYGGANDIEFGTNGAITQTATSGTGGLDFPAQSVNVVINYNASAQTVTENLTGVTTGATATYTFGTNLAADLNGTQAYLGFTGGTGDGTAQQLFTNLSISINGAALANSPVAITNAINTAANTSSILQVTTSGSNTGESVGAINISSGSKVTLAISTAGSPRAVLVTPQITFLPPASGTAAYTGILDLGSNDLDVTNGSLAQITSYVATGYNLTGGANWKGPGITSSSAAANSAHLTALGVISNNGNGGGQLYGSGTALGLFDGYSPSSSDILVKYTYLGDANLDGKVDGSDYSLIDAGYASGGSLTGWYNGDFNYDGVIDGSDYALIDNAFNNQGSPENGSATALVAAETAQVAAVTGPAAAVPEPASLGLIAAVSLALAGRRRRR